MLFLRSSLAHKTHLGKRSFFGPVLLLVFFFFESMLTSAFRRSIPSVCHLRARPCSRPPQHHPLSLPAGRLVVAAAAAAFFAHCLWPHTSALTYGHIPLAAGLRVSIAREPLQKFVWPTGLPSAPALSPMAVLLPLRTLVLLLLQPSFSGRYALLPLCCCCYRTV